MLVAGDISVDGTKILLRQAHSEGRNYAFSFPNYCLLIVIFHCHHKHDFSDTSGGGGTDVLMAYRLE